MKPVDESTLKDLLDSGSTRRRRSAGAELVEEFLQSGDSAVVVTLANTKERNAVAISAASFLKSAHHQVWVKKQGGSSGTELLLVNLAKADAATRRAYETRPRPGRRARNA